MTRGREYAFGRLYSFTFYARYADSRNIYTNHSAPLQKKAKEKEIAFSAPALHLSPTSRSGPHSDPHPFAAVRAHHPDHHYPSCPYSLSCPYRFVGRIRLGLSWGYD